MLLSCGWKNAIEERQVGSVALQRRFRWGELQLELQKHGLGWPAIDRTSRHSSAAAGGVGAGGWT